MTIINEDQVELQGLGWFKELGYQYKDGYENGPWIQWYSNGKREMKMNYVNGVPRGRARFWFPDGSLRGEGIVRNEVPGGGWILMDAEGNKKVYK